MRIWTAAILAAVSLSACRYEHRQAQGTREAQVIALSVRSEPSGAKVRVNQLARTWTTPCNIADYTLQKGPLNLEVTLEGYAPIRKQVVYDGSEPVDVRLKLEALAPAPVAAAPEPPKAVPAPPPAEPAAPSPVAVETTAGGTRIKVSAKDVKIRIQARTVVTDPEKPGEFFLPNVPPDKVVVEFLDPKTDAPLQAVEFTPSKAPEAPLRPPTPTPAPAVKETPAVGADRVGEVKVVSKTYGVFVKLDPGLSVQPGEEILIYRDGREIARTKILKITKGDAVYPDGAAQVQKDGPIQKGDEVRRPKP